jgi:predicted acyltransferase
MCGKLLLLERKDGEKIKALLLAGAVGLLIGFGLDWAGITPIIKRISTSAFVLASGGWAILALAFFYWLIDVKKYKKWTFAFLIVGMNPIFIYLFAQVLGHDWLTGFVRIFSYGFLGYLGFPENTMALLTAFLSLACMWYLCYFLYTKKIFFKI